MRHLLIFYTKTRQVMEIIMQTRRHMDYLNLQYEFRFPETRHPPFMAGVTMNPDQETMFHKPRLLLSEPEKHNLRLPVWHG
jgi:hypothetical protein